MVRFHNCNISIDWRAAQNSWAKRVDLPNLGPNPGPWWFYNGKNSKHMILGNPYHFAKLMDGCVSIKQQNQITSHSLVW
jgi:hypothetical protein